MKPFEKAIVPQAELDRLRAELKAKPPEFFMQWMGQEGGEFYQTQVDQYINELIERSANGAHWNNDKYQVVIVDAELSAVDWPPMWHLSIKRHDRYPVFNWRDIQTIKNELIGPEHEALQLFPAESRLVDGANQYHLFALKDPHIRFPFGFANRVVSDESLGKSKNRSL